MSLKLLVDATINFALLLVQLEDMLPASILEVKLASILAVRLHISVLFLLPPLSARLEATSWKALSSGSRLSICSSL
jgi:hypothetical protein